VTGAGVNRVDVGPLGDSDDTACSYRAGSTRSQGSPRTDVRRGRTLAIVWHGPGRQGVTENESDSGQRVLEVLNRFGAHGWRELAGLLGYRGRGGTSHT
jgi:hypothetical protein